MVDGEEVTRRLKQRSRRGIAIAFSSCGVAVALAGCGSSQAATPSTVTQTVIRETVTVAPPAPETSTAAEPAAEPTAADVETSTPAQPETFTMPRLVGKNLQLAQDTLQNLGSFVMDQQDASGLGRLQVNDSNWKVCSQQPKAGAKVPVETIVVLASVKLDETC